MNTQTKQNLVEFMSTIEMVGRLFKFLAKTKYETLKNRMQIHFTTSMSSCFFFFFIHLFHFKVWLHMRGRYFCKHRGTGILMFQVFCLIFRFPNQQIKTEGNGMPKFKALIPLAYIVIHVRKGTNTSSFL